MRPEGSVVDTQSTTPGLVFGKAGTATTQGWFLIKTGIIFSVPAGAPWHGSCATVGRTQTTDREG